jgi:thiopurine S-methyltransferase
MDPDFWHARWRERQIAFNQPETNPLLVEHWRTLGVRRDALVFVPLAGKSIDMRWLRKQGHSIVAVELSPVAIAEFFDESGLSPTRTTEGPFEVWRADGYRVLQGDFFDLREEHLEGVEAVYDRAALIALPPPLRAAYSRALAERLPASAGILLIAMESHPIAADGPPFTVQEDEVRSLFRPAFHVEVLERTAFEQVTRGDRVVSRASVAYALSREPRR